MLEGEDLLYRVAASSKLRGTTDVISGKSDSDSESDTDSDAGSSAPLPSEETSKPHTRHSTLSRRPSGGGSSSSKRHTILKRSPGINKCHKDLRDGKKAYKAVLPSRAKVRFQKVEKDKIPFLSRLFFI